MCFEYKYCPSQQKKKEVSFERTHSLYEQTLTLLGNKGLLIFGEETILLREIITISQMPIQTKRKCYQIKICIYKVNEINYN